MGYQPMIFFFKTKTWAGSPCHVGTTCHNSIGGIF
jgi:hypothetical protein